MSPLWGGPAAIEPAGGTMLNRGEMIDSAPRRLRRVVLVAAGVLLATMAQTLLVGQAAAKPVFVQKRAFRVSSGTNVSVRLRKPSTAGNLIIAYVVWDNSGTVSLSDSAGDTYASAIGPTTGAGATSAQIFYAANIVSGMDTVSAQFGTAITTRGVLYVQEYSGLDPQSPLDAAVAAAGSSPTMDSGMLATSTGDELLFAGGASDGRTRRAARGYKVRSRKYGNLTADEIVVAAGSYDATATQTGTSWIMQLAAFKPPGGAPPNDTAPLQVSANGRYLVQDSVPFLITGDSPQALIVNLSEADADAFFADRQAAGFNLVWINLLCDTYTGGRADGSTYDGILPFNTPGDLSTPNESYFARVDDMLNLAAKHGLTVLLDPAETGGWLGALSSNGVSKARDYGHYLGNRYRAFGNIVWMSGNDFQSWPTPADDAVVQAVALGIRDIDDRHIHTVELDYPVSGSLDDSSWAPIIQLNASYTYYPTYAQVLTDYNRMPVVPTFLVEANYEFEHNAADEGTPEILRRQAYWSLLSGAAGQMYGNHYTWPFLDGWQSQLDTPGSLDMGYVRFLFTSRRWYDLVPDQSHTVVTAGYDTFADSGALGDNDYLTAARTADGALALVYMPTVRTITVQMSALAMPAYAYWYDPTNGTFAAIPGSPLANSGTRDFTPAGDNSAGSGDWVLVLEVVPPDTAAPSIPAGLSATAVSSTQAAIAWNASTDNVGVAGYQIYRDGMLIRTTPATTYTDTGLSPRTSYSYTVVAYDYANNASLPSTPLTVTTSGAGPAFVQGNYATPQSPVSNAAVAYPAAQVAGDTNIVAIGWNDTTASITSVTDSAGNTYQPAVSTHRGNGLSQAVYYSANVAAAGPGSNQVSVSFDQPAAYVDVRVAEYVGLGVFDAGASASGTGSVANSGTVTTAASGELLFAAGMTGTSFTAPGAGWTTRVSTLPDGDVLEDLVAASAGSYSATASLGSGTWLLQLAAFKAAGP